MIMKHSYVHVLSVAMFLMSIQLQAQSDDMLSGVNAQQLNQIEEIVSTYAEYGKFNGSALVTHEHELIYKKAFGLANMEWDVPNSPKTKFRISTLTQQFTALLILQLAQEKKIDLQASIATYLIHYPKENGDKITLHHLLSHTSGIPDYTHARTYPERSRSPIEPLQILELFADSTLMFEPGEKFNYSNSNYIVLGLLIEQITGKSFHHVLKEKILDPLGMKNTGLERNQNILESKASAYYQQGGMYRNANYIDMSTAFAANGMYSTVEDMRVWIEALDSEKLVSNKFRALLFTPHTPAWRQHYGYGWSIGTLAVGNTEERIPAYYQDGSLNGYNCLIVKIPSLKSSIIFMNNTSRAPLFEMTKAIVAVLQNTTYELPKKSLAYDLMKVFEQDGVDAGIAFYEQNKSNDFYIIDEREMNVVGYNMKQKDQMDAALAMFQLNIQTFPYSSNTYDSYAELLMHMGEKQDAIENYKKSVRLNPNNENGFNMLHSLGVDIEPTDLYVLQSDLDWGVETFTFPLRFASDIDLAGTEQAYFPSGWSDAKHPAYFSYVFVWHVEAPDALKLEEITQNLQRYFDGLMGAVNKEPELIVPKTKVKLKPARHDGEALNFVGTTKVHDSFVQRKQITLSTEVTQHYCPAEGMTAIVFRFSPAGFGADIWELLRSFKLNEGFCE